MLIPINAELLDNVTAAAETSPRRRMIHRFHEHPDPVQRMINVIEPDSYIMPHRHANPDKVEAFITLRGRAAIISFDDDGTPISCHIIAPNTDTVGVEIPPRTWHCLMALEPHTAVYEVLEGPYIAADHKTFAHSFAPPAEDTAAGLEWMRQVKGQLGIDD